MRIILLYILILICVNAEAQYDNDITVEILFVNVMTGAKAKYKYEENKLKAYKSKQGDTFRLIATRRIKNKDCELIVDRINQLAKTYENSSANFINSGMLDGFTWDVVIKTEDRTIEYKVENCYNKHIDNIISVLNEKLKRKKLIIETGLMFASTNEPCE